MPPNDSAESTGGRLGSPLHDEFVRAKSGEHCEAALLITVRLDREIGFRLVSLVRVVETMPLML